VKGDLRTVRVKLDENQFAFDNASAEGRGVYEEFNVVMRRRPEVGEEGGGGSFV
jgi:hypothetical protein